MCVFKQSVRSDADGIYSARHKSKIPKAVNHLKSWRKKQRIDDLSKFYLICQKVVVVVVCACMHVYVCACVCHVS